MGEAGLDPVSAGDRAGWSAARGAVALLAVLAVVAALLVGVTARGDARAVDASAPPPADAPTSAADASDAPAVANGSGAPAQPSAPAPPPDEPADGELVVAYRPGTSAAQAAALERGVGAAVRAGGDDVAYRLVEVPVGEEDELAAALRERPEVAFVERPVPAYPAQATERLPDDPLWWLDYGPRAVRLPATWARSVGDRGVTIAVVDTGVNVQHPDLAGRTLLGKDVWLGTRDVTDTHGHGTKSALVAAATGSNGAGLAGGCWECRVLPVKVARQDGLMWSSEVARGIAWAAEQGADIISVSVVIDYDMADVRQAVQDATGRGSLVIAAAGNTRDTTKRYPAAYPEALAVAGSRDDDSREPRSSYGPWVDLAAPYCNWVAWPSAAEPYEFCGTSSATPLTAGALGVTLSLAPHLTAAQLRAAAESTAVPVPGAYVEDGRVDVADAAHSVVGDQAWWGAFPPQAPTVTAVSAGEASASVSWSYSGDVPVTGFTVTSQPDGMTAAVGGAARTATVDGLRPGVTYRFTVRGDGLAEGIASAPSAGVVPTGTVELPAVPDVRAVPRDGAVEVTWTRLVDYVDLVTGYRVVLVDTGDGSEQVVETDAAASSVSVPATNGHRYTATVTALADGDLAGPPSDVSAAATPLGEPVATLVLARPALHGRPVDLRASVRHATDGEPLVGMPVSLQQRVGSAPWLPVATGTTDQRGEVWFSRPPGSAVSYQLVVAEVPTWATATSATLSVPATGTLREAPAAANEVTRPTARDRAPAPAGSGPIRPERDR